MKCGGEIELSGIFNQCTRMHALPYNPIAYAFTGGVLFGTMYDTSLRAGDRCRDCFTWIGDFARCAALCYLGGGGGRLAMYGWYCHVHYGTRSLVRPVERWATFGDNRTEFPGKRRARRYAQPTHGE